MKHLKLIIILLLCSVQFISAQMTNINISSSQRLAYTAAKKLMGTNDTYKYYVSKTTVKKKGVSHWLVFVDKMPRAGWEHPCSYVYVNPGEKVLGNCIVIDSVCPPSDIQLTPVLKSNGAADDIVEINVEKGAENKYASHTYAVILSGGKDINSNSSRYWNDCSFIYQTLTKKYNVPKSNVKVVMSDGTDPSDDMCDELGSATFSSPLDLDGDGSADIEYSATKSNLKKVFSDLSSLLGDEDHLFVYVIDHGGYDKQKKTSFISLWNGEKLYPDELNSYLANCGAGYISFLMGQCNAGGFVKPLQARNRIIMTACGKKEQSFGCEELPFDEYVYRWTCGINGRDAYGNLLHDFFYAANYIPYYKTLKAAHAYACNTDIYVSENAIVSETPEMSIFENSTADDLTFDYVPDVCELYITSGEEPTTPREVFILSDEYSEIDFSKPLGKQISPMPRRVYWNSADIWLRHQDDGLSNHTHQSGCLGEEEKSVYAYAKIRNRGVKTYDSSSKVLKLWWARSAMKIDMNTWKGMKTYPGKGVYGSNMGWTPILETLEPGDSVVVSLDYTFNNGYLTYARQKDFNICLLAFVVDESELEDSEGAVVDDKTLGAKVWSTKRMAQKNLTSVFEQTIQPAVVIPNFNGMENCELRTTTSSADSAVFKNMNIYLNVSNGSVASWTSQKRGELSPKVQNPTLTSNRVMLTDNCRIGNIQLTGKKVCSMTVSAEEIASKDILEDRDYTINVELYDKELGTSLGGQSFIVRQKARKGIDFEVSNRLDGKGNYELRMTSPSEELTCTWMDKDGNVIASGTECLVPANAASNVYTVEAKSVADGAVNYKDVVLQRISKIENVRNVSNGEISVDFSSPAGKNTCLRLSSASSGQSAKDYPVEEGATNVIVPTDKQNGTVSAISLVENGKLTENIKIVK